MMEKIAFRMMLKPGCVDLYRQRHDEIWPELADLLTKAGIRDYSIFHDPETDAIARGFVSQSRSHDGQIARAGGDAALVGPYGGYYGNRRHK